MPLPPVHFAFGMGASALLGPLMVLVRRRRWLLWLPLAMSLCGLLATVPDLVAGARKGSHLFDFRDFRELPHGHRPIMDAFFLHRWLDAQDWLDSRAATERAFQAIVLAYLAAACGYAAYIRWGLPRMAEAEEALARMRRTAAPYRPAAALAGIVPLVLVGAALGWMVWTMRLPEPPSEAAEQRDERDWAQLIARRMGVDPGERLGLVRRAWDGEGRWLCGDLGASTAFSGGAARPAELVEQARARGCDFVVLADAAALASPEEAAACAAELRAARQKHPDVAALSGLWWEAPPGERALVLAAPQEADLLARFCRESGRSSAEAALRWLEEHNAAGRAAPVVFSVAPSASDGTLEELFAWHRTNGLFAGILGLSGSERLSVRDARSAWDPRVARVGGAWDQLLDRGFRLWGAGAASGGGLPAIRREAGRDFWPGEFARTHLWSRGGAPEDVLAALRAGAFWAEEGRIVDAVDFALRAPALERPARMGEIARVAPGDEVTAALTLDLPATDFAGRANQIDQVDLVSNFDGEPKVIASFHAARSGQRLEHTFAPAEDYNGGLGFYVRARGWRRLDEGTRLCFYTNPIRVLVRAGSPPVRPPSPPPTRVVEERAPSPRPPTTAQAVPPAAPDARAALAPIGLPPSVRLVHIETFRTQPAVDWRGAYSSYVADAGPAMGDDGLRVEFLKRTPVSRATRLFFRCFAHKCGSRVTVLARTSKSAGAWQAVRALPDEQWAAFDLSLDADLLPARGSGALADDGSALEALEWRAEGIKDLSRFYIRDFVLYEPTAASRQEAARKRADELGLALAGAISREATPAAQQRLDLLATRLAGCKARLDPATGALDAAQLAAAEAELADIAEGSRRLRLQGAMARAFGLSDPKLAVAVAGPLRRFRSSEPADLASLEPATACEFAGAGGEAESCQVIVAALWDKLAGVEIIPSDLLPVEGQGPSLPASALSAALVGEVPVKPRAALLPDQTGSVPDPLLPLQPFDVEPGTLRALLVTVNIPPELVPGDYQGTLAVRSSGVEAVRLAVRLRRWDFALAGRHFPVIAPLDERALRALYGVDRTLPQARRRELYGLLLRYRADPVPLLSGDEAADLDDIAFCLERGAALAVLHEAPSLAPRSDDAGTARAARYAAKLWEAGWGRRAALLLPRSTGDGMSARAVAYVNGLGRSHPSLLLIAGGDGEPPGDLITNYWRRPLGPDAPRRPRPEAVEVRLSRTARREAWEPVAGTPESPVPNLLLTNPLLDVRLLPWLAWQHGVRALVLRGTTRWGGNDLGDGVLVYPGPDGAPCPSLRLVALRDGAEDYECLRLLWDRARQLRERAPDRYGAVLADVDRWLAEAMDGIGTFERPCSDPRILALLRARLGREAERFDAAWWAEVDRATDLPAPPAELTATAADGQVALAWSKSPDEKATAYELFRSCDPKKGFVRLGDGPIDAFATVDRSARNGATYYYFVRSCRDKTIDGPRSRVVSAAPRAAPRVAWLPMADLTQGTVGPYRVLLRLEGPGTGGLLPLVRPQIDYALSDGAPDGFEDMARREDGSWAYDIPDLGWRRQAGKTLRILVRIADRRNRVVTPEVERQELIDAAPAP